MKDKLNALLKDYEIVFAESEIKSQVSDDVYSVLVSNTEERIGFDFVVENMKKSDGMEWFFICNRLTHKNDYGDYIYFYSLQKKSIKSVEKYIKDEFCSELIYHILDCSQDPIEEKIISLLEFDNEILSRACDNRIRSRFTNERYKSREPYTIEDGYNFWNERPTNVCYKHVGRLEYEKNCSIIEESLKEIDKYRGKPK